MNKIKGYICAILAAVGFGVSPMIATHIYDYGVSAFSLGMLRVLVMSVVFLIIILIQRKTLKIPGKQLLQSIFLALTGGVLTTAMLFTAYNCIDTSVATTLNFSYPVFVLVLGILIYKDKVTKGVLVSFALCIAGILLFCNPNGNFTWKGFFLALGSGVAYGVYALYMEKSAIMEKVDFNVYTFYFFLFSSVGYLPIVLVEGNMTFRLPALCWLLVLAFSLTGGLIATVLFQIGVRDIGSSKATILAAMEPVTSLVMGTLFLGEKLTLMGVAGIVLVLASTIVLVLVGNQEKPENAEN